MTIICYSYHISSAYWKKNLSTEEVNQICEFLNSYPLSGPEGESFGFWMCGVLNGYIYGYFVQQIHEGFDHIDANKNRIPTRVVNAIKYPFFIDYLNARIVIQHRRGKKIITSDKLVGKFMGLYDMIMNKNENRGIIGRYYGKEEHGFERDFVVDKFFNVNSKVVEIKASNFKGTNVREGFNWFNPNPPNTEELTKEGELIIQNVNFVEIKANEGGNLRKVPDARFYVESSQNPTITIKEGNVNKKYAPKREAEIRISIENPENMSEEGFNDFIRKIAEAVTGEVLDKLLENGEQNLLFGRVIENNE